MNDDVKTAPSTDQVIDEKSAVDPVLLEEVVKAGVLFGRKKTKTHPRMQKYIFTTRNEMEIIDVVQTLGLIDRAADFLRDTAKKGGLILFVGTIPAAKDLVKALAVKFNYPYVTERWLGGTLTNWKTLHERIKHFIKLKVDRESGKLEKYTKKERIEFDKEIARMSILFGGLEFLSKLPDAVVVVGASSHMTAIREARRVNIPIACLLSSDADPDLATYPIPGNDRSRQSIAWVLGKIEKAVEEGRVIANNANPPAGGAQNNANTK